jgi:hypothetical protein
MKCGGWRISDPLIVAIKNPLIRQRVFYCPQFFRAQKKPGIKAGFFRSVELKR